jgi:molybdopterin-guanine dinucleotide biosynthesis protein A
MVPTLAILAGGQGARMGTPKALLQLDGKPILERLLDRLDWPGSTLLVTAPGVEHPPAHERFTSEVVDPIAGQGPLRGIVTALEAATTSIVVVSTVDMPNITREQLDWMISRFEILEHCIALACRPVLRSEFEPFPCVLRPGASDFAKRLLCSNHPAVKSLFELPNSKIIDAPDDWPPSTWVNLNRPEDLDLLCA